MLQRAASDYRTLVSSGLFLACTRVSFLIKLQASCEFCEISKNTFFTELLWTTAEVKLYKCRDITNYFWNVCKKLLEKKTLNIQSSLQDVFLKNTVSGSLFFSLRLLLSVTIICHEHFKLNVRK